ncbi:MAG: ABC transporter permease subunit [Verrucomicrobia bacterium]|nr:ABC transporter permease subunit [Verrucomicrobiota bacterium]
MFFTQLNNELLKLFARKRTHIGFGAFVAAEFIILLLLQLQRSKKTFTDLLTRNGYGFDYYSGITLAVLMILFTIFLLGGLYLALVSGDMVAKEVEDGTMRMVLARPISRIRLLGIKWLACMIYTFALILFIGGTSLLAGVLYRGGLGKLFIFAPHEQLFAIFDSPAEGVWRFARAIFVLSLCIQVVSTLGLMFSCFNMKPATATILTLSVMFVDFVLRNMPYFEGIQRWFITYHTACWVRTFHPIVPWWGILESLFCLFGLNVTFFVIGAMSFCARDFKA